MKKCFKLMFAAMISLVMVVPAQANDLLTVYEGVGSSSYVPFRNIDFQDEGLHSQLIYPADVLAEMNGQQINAVTFYLKEGMYASDGMLVVKVGETDNAYYATATDFRTDLVQVAAMPLAEGITELNVVFTTPYLYQGGNLVIDFTNPEVGDDNYYAWNTWVGQTTGSYNYTAIGSNGAMATFLPKATFDYGVLQDWEAKVTPLWLEFNLPAEREEIQTIKIVNRGLNPFTPSFSKLYAPLSIETEPVELATGESLDVAVKFAPEQELTGYAQLTIDCGQAGSFQVWIDVVATAPVYEVTVGDKASNNEFLPFRGYYMDVVGTYGQMIYTEEMMGATKGNKITKLTFYPTGALSESLANGEVQLSFKNLDEQIEFESATPLTEMTAVATTVIQGGETELVFVLDEPYQYNGGSLAIEALVTERSTSFARTYFYGDNYDYWPSFYHYASTYSETNERYYFLPMVTFAYDKVDTPQPEWEVGDVNHDYAVDVSDVTALITYVLNGAADDFFENEANVNGEGGIDVADVTALISLVLGGN